jgi:Tol biopolymer transport system component
MATGGTWNLDGYIYFNPSEASVIHRVSSAGGVAEPLTNWQERTGCSWVESLPNNENFLVSGMQLMPWGGIFVADFKAKNFSLINKDCSYAKYVPTGHIVFARRGRLMALGFDDKKLEKLGDPVIILEDLRTEELGAAQFSISNDGTLIYLSGQHSSQGSLIWRDRDDNIEPAGMDGLSFGQFDLSPDGQKIVLQLYDLGNEDIWVYDIQRGSSERITYGGLYFEPIWHPDSKSLAYTSRPDYTVFWKSIEEAGEAIQITSEDAGFGAAAFTTDGKGLIAYKHSVSSGWDMWLLSLDSENRSELRDKEPKILLKTNSHEFFPALSPDGKWIAFTTNRDGRWEIYVAPYPSMERLIPISTTGGEEPLWNPNGKELIYRWEDRWYVVDVETEPSFKAGNPRLLFEGSYINVPGYSWDMSPDGERFLLIENPEHTKVRTELVVITNFFELLRQKVPVKNN